MLDAAKTRVCSVVDTDATDWDNVFGAASLTALSPRNSIQAVGDKEDGNLPGSGLTVETSPLSFPNRSVVLRGRMQRWKCPAML
jgi:hypothetical protein